MKFFLPYFNHREFNGCVEHLSYLRNALAQAGYSAALTRDLLLAPEAVNILLECFNPEQAAEIVKAHRELGLRLVVVASEVVTGGTLNDFNLGPGFAHYSNRAYWQQRFNCFLEVARCAEAIWCLSDHQLDGYRRILPEKRIETIPLCFDAVDAQAESSLAPSKDIGVLFFGSLTPYRMEMIKSMPICVYVAHNLPKPVLSDFIRRSRVCLHLHLAGGWPYSSNMRHHALLARQAYVLSESSPLAGELDPYLDICPRSGLADRTRELLERSDLPELAAQAQARYAAERPIGPAIAALVSRSLGSPT